MVSHLDQAHAALWVCHQNLLAEVLSFVAQRVEGSHCVVSLLQVQVRDVRVCVVLTFSCEGSLPCQ